MARVIDYVEYLTPGSFFPEPYVREVESRDVDAAVAAAPPNAYGMAFFSVIETEVEADGKVEVLRSNRIHLSERFYLGGQVYTLAEVRALDLPGALVSNMECNGWPTVIKCRPGNWQPFEPEKGDTLISVEG